MLSILTRWPHVSGHKKTLVDILLNIFSKDHKESLKSLNAPEAGTQAPSASSGMNSGEGEVCAGVPPCP